MAELPVGFGKHVVRGIAHDRMRKNERNFAGLAVVATPDDLARNEQVQPAFDVALVRAFTQ